MIKDILLFLALPYLLLFGKLPSGSGIGAAIGEMLELLAVIISGAIQIIFVLILVIIWLTMS